MKSIYVLGIYNGHNASAAILRDGEIIACVSEERFVGIKNYIGFPRKSIEWCLSYAGIDGKDLDAVAIPSNLEVPTVIEDGKSKDLPVNLIVFFYKLVAKMRSFWGKVVYKFPYLRSLGWYSYMFALRTIGQYSAIKQKQFIARYLHIPTDKVVTFDHHLSHAASAYYSSEFNDKKALVFTLDGEGDGLCSTVSVFHKNYIKRIAFTTRENSIGQMYAFVTKFLGMKPGEHEYKVMGLAPYAKQKDVSEIYDKIKHIVTLNPFDRLRFYSTFNTQDSYRYFKNEFEGIRFDTIAGVMQTLVERRLEEWVSHGVGKTGITTILGSGGVFMNVKANQKITALSKVKHAYFMPSAGDESTPIGACYLAFKDICRNRNKRIAMKPLNNLYLGPSFSNEHIEIILKKRNLYKNYKIKEISNIEKEIARLLSSGRVVARMAGRMEFGARALGNRSILANPSRIEVVRIINEQIKSRDFWMPFSPTILHERMNDYCKNPKKINAQYMTVSFDSTPLAREHFKAAMHSYDFTLRPQVLRKEWSESYYELIKEFERLTGIGGVLNTSFNLHGYPIVMGPKEALYVFEHSGIDYLALESFLIEKL
jgi:carbamoyltransferase